MPPQGSLHCPTRQAEAGSLMVSAQVWVPACPASSMGSTPPGLGPGEGPSRRAWHLQ